MSQCDDILALLSDGREHEMRAIHRAIGFCRLNSRVAELRKRGHNIVCRKQGGEYHYRLIAGLGATEAREPLPQTADSVPVAPNPEQLALV